jgi:purine-binding chemotaxis protein CheW
VNALAPVLLIRVGSQLAALPLAEVIETMRPLPCEGAPGAPPFVLGVSVIRGAPVTVVDLARLAGAPAQAIGRFVTMRVGGRCIALAVAAVVGTRTIEPTALTALPPLLSAGADLVRALGALDRQLLIVLESGRAWVDRIPAASPEGGAP